MEEMGVHRGFILRIDEVLLTADVSVMYGDDTREAWSPGLSLPPIAELDHSVRLEEERIGSSRDL